ncbi:MAG: hypothetical protein ACP5SB_02770 [Caldisericaceae bacterium]
MAVGAVTKKVSVLILTDVYIIRGYINSPANMRLSDSINKFLRETQFLAVTDAEITVVSTGALLEKRDFVLVNKDLVRGLSPNE